MNSLIQKITIVYLLYAGTLVGAGEAEVSIVDMIPACVRDHARSLWPRRAQKGYLLPCLA